MCVFRKYEIGLLGEKKERRTGILSIVENRKKHHFIVMTVVIGILCLLKEVQYFLDMMAKAVK